MGSKLGWILSGVMVAVLIVVLLVMGLSSSPTPPTPAITRPGFFEVYRIELPIGPLVGGAEPSAPGDAADDYRQAAEVYRANLLAISDALDRRDDIEAGKHTPPPAAVAVLERLAAHVSAGATKKEMHFTRPADIAVRYADEQASQLVRLADALSVLAAIREAAKDYQAEENLLRAWLILGWHMTREGVRATMTLQGLEVQGGAVGYLGRLYSQWDPPAHSAVNAALEEYSQVLEKAHRHWGDKLYVVWRPVPNPGDVFAVVQRDKDRAWRVEGLLACGAVRFTHSKSSGDVAEAKKLLNKYASDNDPFVKAAATASRDLTGEGFLRVGTPPTK